MAVSITCHGCGQYLRVPAGYQRRKMQCPQCGVYCEVPPPAQRNPLAAKRTGSAAEELPAQTAEAPASPADDAATELALDVWSDPHRPPQAIPPPVEPETVYADTDDGRPYQLAGGAERKCSNCSKVLATDAALCPHCGFNSETGKKAVRVFEPLALHWDAGLPFQRRLRFFALAECAALALALVGAFLAGHPGESFSSWLFFTVLLAFLLGTFDRLDLTRNKRGRVVLTQTWRVCFFARPTTTIALHEYEGVMTNLSHDAGPLDWVVLGVLLLSAIIPGLIWWFWAMQQDTYHVALTKNHGYPECILYRGWNQSRATEIARTLHDVSGLPYEGVTI